MSNPRRTPPRFPKTSFRAGLARLVLLLTATTALVPQQVIAEPAPEELVIFVRHSANSEIALGFDQSHLPALRSEAEKLGVALRVIDIDEKGAPPEVHVTPLVAYQSHKGRALFQGRYADSGKVAHFIRTQRAIPPTGGGYSKKDAAVLTLGRAKILAPIKVTPLAGALEADFDNEKFAADARSAILDGFERFERLSSVTMEPSDRTFYMDFHPYRAEDGTLWVSTALFSQFNCIEPVFTGFESPISGPFAKWQKVLANAARQLEQQVEKQLASSTLGDGFDPVPSSVANVDWQTLGLALPPKPAGSSVASADVPLPERWRIEDPQAKGAPRLVFRFPPPLERYSGEVGALDGALHLASSLPTSSTEGFIEVATASVTMGEDALDNALRGKMIFVDRFPKARFDLEKITDSEPLAFGRSSRLVAEGSFTMMGLSIPLQVRAQLEPVIADDGLPRLHVQAGFEVRLKTPFGVQGPDGPSPANDTLQFNLDFLMQAAAQPKSQS